MTCLLIRIVVLAALMALCGCAATGLGGVSLLNGAATGALAGIAPAISVDQLLQEDAVLHNLQIGLDQIAATAGPVTMISSTPIIATPSMPVVTPAPVTPVVGTPVTPMPAPVPVPTPTPTPSPSTGPIVTPSQSLAPHSFRRRINWRRHPAELYHLTAFTPSLEPSFCFAADLSVHPSGEC